MQHRPKLFYTTDPSPCPYLPDRMERKILTVLSRPSAPALYDRLSQAGFRRSHSLIYAPACANCQACIPIRIPARLFKISRGQKRVWKHYDRHIQAIICPPFATTEQFSLFQRYQNIRHANGDMADMFWDEYKALIENTPIHTIIIEFRLKGDDTLICVSLVDVMEDGLSAVYTFYDPENPSKSWGTYSILWLIEQTIHMQKSYLYLGYYVPGSQKMAYKTNFQPAEIFRNGHWLEYQTAV
ncbi:arginyltransferase [Swingsia samuiensis]|uniref:Aspartate/glutamate leucyltransferase n=1 Tax=Swingsia samuiensis TaxID=1293412 RepID=A0A4Y6UF84_9PROT|nr:arginyltransferase [Swingsia samuiensis]QDH16192.1 arginyltransferase [Swingsia samuiensis]